MIRVPTPAQWAAMPWHARAALTRHHLEILKTARATPKTRPVFDHAASRARAQAILAALPADPDAAAHRAELNAAAAAAWGVKR